MSTVIRESFTLAQAPATVLTSVELDYQLRQKSRGRAPCADGSQLAWFVDRGRVLADGDLLQCQDGAVVAVVAAPESVSEVVSGDPLLLMRAAYHLGNRHVPLQIGEALLRYQHDHVLDDMLRGLGLAVTHTMAPFHPEPGAYHGQGGHSHGGHHHDHDHAHG